MLRAEVYARALRVSHNAKRANGEIELELIQIQTAQKPIFRAEVHARALRASQTIVF
jgi:hypothetical protein